jgi:hypothetical protein
MEARRAPVVGLWMGGGRLGLQRVGVAATEEEVFGRLLDLEDLAVDGGGRLDFADDFLAVKRGEGCPWPPPLFPAPLPPPRPPAPTA